jgi:hypothetical protein
MVVTPSRTQSITPYMNKRIVQPTPGIQIGDLDNRCRRRFDGAKAQRMEEDHRNKEDVNGQDNG